MQNWRLLNFYNKLILKFGQQNATEMRFCWRTGDGPTLNAGLVSQGNRTRFATKPYFSNFSWGGGGGGIQTSCAHHLISLIVFVCKMYSFFLSMMFIYSLFSSSIILFSEFMSRVVLFTTKNTSSWTMRRLS